MSKHAVANAKHFLSDGADGVKLEGGIEKGPIVTALAEQGIETCAHIGHNPQIHGSKAATHGKTFAKAKRLIEAASVLAEAGAKLIVLEKITEEVSQIITETIDIPTIGIGAGRYLRWTGAGYQRCFRYRSTLQTCQALSRLRPSHL